MFHSPSNLITFIKVMIDRCKDDNTTENCICEWVMVLCVMVMRSLKSTWNQMWQCLFCLSTLLCWVYTKCEFTLSICLHIKSMQLRKFYPGDGNGKNTWNFSQLCFPHKKTKQAENSYEVKNILWVV